LFDAWQKVDNFCVNFQYPDDPGMHNNRQGDQYTRVTYRDNPGFCERVKNSLVGIVVGLVLIVVASGLLFWNEVRLIDFGLFRM
jgi:hypothetical protein